MFQRLTAILFTTLFFAALPAWFLSTLEGWIYVDCFRSRSNASNFVVPMECKISEQFAFSSRSTSYPTMDVRSSKTVLQVRRGKSVTYQLVLVTPDGEREVLRAPIGKSDIDRIAIELKGALRSGSTEFHAAVDPEPLFWIGWFLLLLFAGVGVLLALFGARSEKTEPQ
ncbi:hypothetical protein DLM76_11020 [Leptospira yasudae]|uniref:hypothetical protein n=1 Tax=Leptospira yasudae TaxID=2202201 RepID=UPI000E599E37|nr:hypothetical protein [Leptospira yasudae]RHX94590.1 hypothetical protein DLM76_11020 [Leptospira yasudae]